MFIESPAMLATEQRFVCRVVLVFEDDVELAQGYKDKVNKHVWIYRSRGE